MAPISDDLIGSLNHAGAAAQAEDYAALGRQLARRGLSIESLTERAMAWTVAVPTWGVGTGGTRFARFPGPGSRAISMTSWKTAASSSN